MKDNNVKKQSLKKDDKIWIAITKRDTCVIETAIKSIGKKYIRVNYDERIKFDVNSLQEIDGYGFSSFLITDLEKYNRDRYIKSIIIKCENFKWSTLEEEDLISVKHILSNYLKEI